LEEKIINLDSNEFSTLMVSLEVEYKSNLKNHFKWFLIG
tara:strand:+ start:494 stop:610 length:117 start_codon:yes stop_codon:yes gene_type:complete